MKCEGNKPAAKNAVTNIMGLRDVCVAGPVGKGLIEDKRALKAMW